MAEHSFAPRQSPAADSVAALGIDQFLYMEAQLLDDGQYDDWYKLLTDDLAYSAPQVEFVDHPDRSLDSAGAHHFDHTKLSMGNHIAWLASGLNNSEIPSSLKVRLITNIRLIRQSAGEFHVESKFYLHQVRWDGKLATFVGRREDCLRQTAEGWKIRSRVVHLGTQILPRALTTLF
jgi:3-phenylpropionate/cinnamic acid dioxygenase small subunit